MSTIDILIFFAFISILFFADFYNSQKVTNLKSYSTPSGSISDFALFTMVFGMFFGATSLFGTADRAYISGFSYFAIACSDAFRILLCCFFMNKLYKYKNYLSIGEIIGNFYGPESRVITGICSFIFCVSMITVQFKGIHKTIDYLFDIDFNIAFLFFILFSICYIASNHNSIRNLGAKNIIFFLLLPIIFYYLCESNPKLAVYLIIIIFLLQSSLRGISSATFKSMILFALMILFLSIVLGEIDLLNLPIKIITDNFYEEFKDFSANLLSSHATKDYILVFLSSIIPILTPPVIQRINLAKSSAQAKNTFILVAISIFVFYHLITICSLITFQINPEIHTITSFNAFLYLVDHIVTVPILKGLAFCGILSVMFSTIDALVNSANINFICDVIKTAIIPNNNEEHDLTLIRFTTFIIGAVSMLLGYCVDNMFTLLILGVNIWSSIITIPLIAGIFDFKGPKIAFYASALSGTIINIIYYLDYSSTIKTVGVVTSSIIINSIVFYATTRIFRLRQKN
jgi:SSS family solute:Na+ symporter